MSQGMRDTAPRGRVLVTGATGKVGRCLVAELLATGQPVRVISRDPDAARLFGSSARLEVRVADLTDARTLDGICEDVETVFHLASYAPRPDEPDIYEAPSHWPVTAEGTANLVAEAARSSVERIIYLSSIKAMGDGAGALGYPADESVTPAPDSLYGRAKHAAEQQVLDWGRRHHRHASVLRLPMVYGLGDGGNIPRMVRAIARGRFPPWPPVENHRAAIHVADAIAAARLVAARPESAGEVYLVTDGRAYSTRWIYEETLRALGRPIPRWSTPLWLLRLAARLGTLGERLTGRRMPLTIDGLGKLLGDAWLSSAKLERTLGFRATQTLEAEIARLAEGERS